MRERKTEMKRKRKRKTDKERERKRENVVGFCLWQHCAKLLSPKQRVKT